MSQQQIILNGKSQTVNAQTVAELLDELGSNEAKFLAVAINNTVIPSSQHSQHKLNPNDQVEIIRPISGG